MSKKGVFAVGLIWLLLGMVAGFLISPVKFGLGNNSGNTTNNYYGSKEQPQECEAE